MGGKSKSSSSQSSNQSSFSQALHGDNSGLMLGGDDNTVNFTQTVTDHGATDAAFGFGGDALAMADSATQGAYSVASEGMNLADSLAHEAFSLVDGVTSNTTELANSAMNNNAALASQSMENNAYLTDAVIGVADNAMTHNASLAQSGMELANTSMTNNAALASQSMENSAMLSDSFIDNAAGMFETGAAMLDGQSARNLDAALAIGEAGMIQTQMGNQLALDMFNTANAASLEQQEDNNNTLENGFKSMMQFADNASRSDGQQLAISTNKTMQYAVLALAGVAGVYLFAVKKK